MPEAYPLPQASPMPDDLALPENLAPAPRSEIIPAFAAVPRAAERSNGWKPDVQRAFIEALAETGSVRAACAHVSRADHGAYMLRRHPEAEEFRRAWDAALDIGMRRIEDVAMDRAINGYQQPVFSYGKHVGERTVYNDRLLMFMLRNRAPERFGGDLRKGLDGKGGAHGENANDPMSRARLKKRWRQEWDDERAAEASNDSAEVYASIDSKLDRMRENWLAGMSPRVRALHDAYEAALDDEEQAGGPDHLLPLLPGVHWQFQSRGESTDDDDDAQDDEGLEG